MSAEKRREITQDNESPGRKNRPGYVVLRGVVMLFVVIITAGLLSIYVLDSANDVFGFNKIDQTIELTIESGMNAADIAKLLDEKGVIEQPITFQYYTKFRNREGIFQAGNYILNSNMSYDQIIIILRTGQTIKEEVKITFFEGMTIREIAKELQEKRVCSASEFISKIEEIEFGLEFENMIPDVSLRFRKLEGYLFPDTYDFYIGERVDSVAKKFLVNFQNKIFPGIYEQIQDKGMTLDEVVILASIIQKEAGNREEMARVSSVFYNRMENPGAGLPRLQSDVTIFYVEEDIKPYQSRSTQDIYDAYNTYVCYGLPVGPICSPGLDAIKAAINPAQTDYYYFVTDKNGEFYYSKTLNEHNANIRKAQSAGGVEHGTNLS
jgi:UPF0755 protein